MLEKTLTADGHTTALLALSHNFNLEGGSNRGGFMVM